MLSSSILDFALSFLRVDIEPAAMSWTDTCYISSNIEPSAVFAFLACMAFGR